MFKHDASAIGDTISMDAAGCQPLDRTRVISGASALRRTARPIASQASWDSKYNFQRMVCQAASPQKKHVESKTTSGSRGGLRGLSASRAKATRAFGPRHLPAKSSSKPALDSSASPAATVTHSPPTREPTVMLNRNCNQAEQQSQNCTHFHRRGEVLSVRLDQEVFRNFWPLLDESRDYARLSGCRFRSRSFDGIDGSEPQRAEAQGRTAVVSAATHPNSDDTDNCLTAARARAAPAVNRFARRLRAGEAGLLEELDKAFRIVMAESVRSAMVATCQVLELWPPSPAPCDIESDDCAFEDVSATIPVIAQRLYNDERRRERLTPHKGDADPLRRRAMMASFIVEFAGAAGVPLPELPETYNMMLQDFKMQALEWEQTQSRQSQMDSAAQIPSPEEVQNIDHSGHNDVAAHAAVAEVNGSHDAQQKDKTWPEVFAGSAIAAVFSAATADYMSLTARRPQKYDL